MSLHRVSENDPLRNVRYLLELWVCFSEIQHTVVSWYFWLNFHFMRHSVYTRLYKINIHLNKLQRRFFTPLGAMQHVNKTIADVWLLDCVAIIYERRWNSGYSKLVMVPRGISHNKSDFQTAMAKNSIQIRSCQDLTFPPNLEIRDGWWVGSGSKYPRCRDRSTGGRCRGVKMLKGCPSY